MAADDTINQKVAASMLARLGYRADVVGDGTEAVAALAQVPYVAVLMDREMPRMDGFEATREIRRREGAGSHTPIAALTAAAMKGDEERCLSAGMDAYVTKPIRLADLEAALGQMLDSAQL
ncbi:MAG: response regulator [Acidimicrobiales bacterium]